MKNTLSVYVPTLNEEVNLPRCLEKLAKLEVTVFVIDSNSADRTVEIAKAAGCQVLTGNWKTFSDKLNWILTELPVTTPWLLRVDADEWLTDELIEELRSKLSSTSSDISAYALKYQFHFMGRWIRHGGYYPLWKINLYRVNKVRCEVRELDEQMIVDGKVGQLDHDIVDDNLNSIANWTAKHNSYSDLEVLASLRVKAENNYNSPLKKITRNRWLRENIFYRIPLFVRPFLYWIYRYFIRLGFLDGMPGLIYHTLHAFWYRFLVDAKLYEKVLNEK